MRMNFRGSIMYMLQLCTWVNTRMRKFSATIWNSEIRRRPVIYRSESGTQSVPSDACFNNPDDVVFEVWEISTDTLVNQIAQRPSGNPNLRRDFFERAGVYRSIQSCELKLRWIKVPFPFLSIEMAFSLCVEKARFPGSLFSLSSSRCSMSS